MKPVLSVIEKESDVRQKEEYITNYIQSMVAVEEEMEPFKEHKRDLKKSYIENKNNRIREFGLNIQKYYGKWILDDGKSYFIHGNSNDPKTIRNLYELTNEVDIIFIDALHSYESVLTDWLVYSPRVKKDGIVAFHDCEKRFPNRKGVAEFIDDLESGNIDGKKYEMNKIVHSTEQGICWYIK